MNRSSLVSRLLVTLGAVLILGGFAHSIGVIHLYVTRGVPNANRALLDVWVAEAQILGGALYLSAFMAARSGAPWQSLAMFGSLTTIGYAGAFLPVLFYRAPVMFRVPTLLYFAVSVWILAEALRPTKRQ